MLRPRDPERIGDAEGLRSLCRAAPDQGSATQHRCCADATGPMSGLTPDKDPRGRQRRPGGWCNASSGSLSGTLRRCRGHVRGRRRARLLASAGGCARRGPRTTARMLRAGLPAGGGCKDARRSYRRGPCLCRPLRWAGQRGPRDRLRVLPLATSVVKRGAGGISRDRTDCTCNAPASARDSPLIRAQVRLIVRTPRGGNIARGRGDHRSRDAIAM